MKIGLVGLGEMGTPMAAALARAGLLAAVHSADTAHTQAVASEHKIFAVGSAGALWDHCDVVLLCLPNDGEVQAVARALALPAASGKTVVDSSTVAPDTAVEVAALLGKVGARFLDAPINGNAETARHARLTFMVGGSEADYAAMTPLFAALGHALRIGNVGSGQAVKAVNQAATAGIAKAVTEALAFSQALELPLHAVIEALSSGAAASWFDRHAESQTVGGRYLRGLKVAVMHKDLTICQQLAAQAGGNLPTVDVALAQYQTLIAEGRGEEDISSIYRLNRRLFPDNGWF
ncbi:NAD(P)-dependent oxidoreductase [Sinimarinibacterium sp. NLF-5-8]|uniref:NAD(P)-dependent oxidoreductase n=1 Tax=Sinimarinibacterium sp. NLF-5-8 TaxID=2698684 RepID=UPI00137BA3A9|nr:NAD(P)-dependent oxidoreductase [Sinimarinibacterium sp. NLF-5-8]QHS10271.1 NAD(P)-dependent oxidoreductase [Sinimarinibacterium sp. NLF-5-8]